jgi:hypothetical protein
LAQCETTELRAFFLLRFETFYEAIELPKFNGVAINRNFCKPPGLYLI